MEKEIIVAIIAALATVVTVIGSILAVKLTSNMQIKEQRIIENRAMKRQYYTRFIDAFSKKLIYMNQPDCKEKTEAEHEFILEANKMTMYASEEMIQFIEAIKNPQIAKEKKMDEFLIILRKDLCDDSFRPFTKISGISLSMPSRVECSPKKEKKKG